MNPPVGDEGNVGTARRSLVIDLNELCWALTSHDPLGQSHWLNLRHARQGSCRLVHAANACWSTAPRGLTTQSRSGFKVTGPTGVQLRVAPHQRRGLRP
jgi:hypothetical protein